MTLRKLTNTPPLPMNYTDENPRLKEDWETTGEDEMSRLHEACKHKISGLQAEHNEKRIDYKRKASVLDVRDKLFNLIDLVTVCIEALTHSELNEVKLHVAHVLYFQVIEQIKLAEQELKQI